MTIEARATTLSWRDAAAAALLAVVLLGGASQRMVPGVVGAFHDDAVYAITAKSLAEGHGYRLLNMPGQPRQTKYPILYPALISAGWAAGSTLETRLFAMQSMTAAAGGVAIALVYLYCVRFGAASRPAALAGCLVAASSPQFLYYCGQTLSEMPFLALLVVALWGAELRLRASERSAVRDLACGVLLALPLLCRSAGVVVPLVAVVMFARERRPLRWLVIGVLVVVVPWLLWAAKAVHTEDDAVVGYQTDYLGWWLVNGSVAVVATNLFHAGAAFCTGAVEAAARELHARVEQPQRILFAVGSLPWIAVVAGCRRQALLPVTLLSYLALICLWPWPPDRFLVPILPLLAVLFAEALRRLVASRGLGRPGTAVLALLLAAAVGSNVWMQSRYAGVSRPSQYPYFTLPGEPVQWRSYLAAFDWLRTHTRDGEVLAAGFDTMTSLYTDRPSIRPFVVRPLALYYGFAEPPLGTVAEFEEILDAHAARYLFVSPLPAYQEEQAFFDLVSDAIEQRPGLLKRVWQAGDDERFLIFEVAQRHAAG